MQTAIDKLGPYLKSILPLVAGIVVLLIDKLGDDSIDDAVWIALLGTSGGVWAVPNMKKANP